MHLYARRVHQNKLFEPKECFRFIPCDSTIKDCYTANLINPQYFKARKETLHIDRDDRHPVCITHVM